MQLAHQLVAGRLRDTERTAAAHCIMQLCARLPSCCIVLKDLVGMLGDAKPGAALRATVARTDRLTRVCSGCAPILVWCVDVLGG